MLLTAVLSDLAVHSLSGWIGWVWVSRLMPFIVIGPLVSPYVDRLSNKIGFMRTVDLARTGLSVGVAIAFRLDPQVWWLLVLVVGESALSVSYTSARNSWVAATYSAQKIGRVNGVLQAISSVTMIIGTILGPLVVVHAGIMKFMILLAGSYALVVVLLRPLLPVPNHTNMPVPCEVSRHSFARSLSRQFKGLRKNPVAIVALVAAGGWGLGGGASNVLNTLLGIQRWHAGAISISITFAALGLGNVLATFVMRVVSPHAPRRWLAFAGWSMLGEGVFQIVFGHSLNMITGGVLALGVGICSGSGDIGFDTAVMTGVNETYQAQIFALIWMTSSISLSASSVGFNYLLRWVSLPNIANIGGSMVGITGVVTVILSHAFGRANPVADNQQR